MYCSSSTGLYAGVLAGGARFERSGLRRGSSCPYEIETICIAVCGFSLCSDSSSRTASAKADFGVSSPSAKQERIAALRRGVKYCSSCESRVTSYCVCAKHCDASTRLNVKSLPVTRTGPTVTPFQSALRPAAEVRGFCARADWSRGSTVRLAVARIGLWCVDGAVG